MSNMKIVKSACNPNNAMHDAIFFSSARNAWKACLRSAMPKKVLLPSYIGYTDREGSGILDPIIDLSIPHKFYSVGKDLQADHNLIASLLDADASIEMLLLVHYFGWPGGNVAAIRKTCDERGVVLVEDCAHAFHWGLETPKLGILGDFAFFSVHKFLPVQSGGILTQPRRKRLVQVDLSHQESDLQFVGSLAKAKLDLITQCRRNNLSLAMQGVESISGLSNMYTDIPEVPQSLPVWIAGESMREKLYFDLMAKGIPTTALYYRMHASISSDEFPDSFDVSNHILNLPIHQDMNEEKILWMLSEINLSLTGLRK